MTKIKLGPKLRTLDRRCPGWRSVVRSQAYQAWVLSLPEAQRTQLAYTCNPDVIRKSIRVFQEQQPGGVTR